MAEQGEPFNSITDEEIEAMMATPGPEGFGSQVVQDNLDDPQAPTLLPPAGGGLAHADDSPVPMARLDSHVGPLANITYPTRDDVSYVPNFNITCGNSAGPLNVQDGLPISCNFLPPDFFSPPTHGLPAPQNNNPGAFDFGLILPAGAPQYLPGEVTRPIPDSEPASFNNVFQNPFNDPSKLTPALFPDSPAMDSLVTPERRPGAVLGSPTGGTSTTTPNVSSSAFFEDLIGDRMSQADRAARRDEIRGILNKDKVPIAVPETKAETPEKPKKAKKRKITKLEPGEKRRAPEMIEVLPYADPPSWPQRRRKNNKMSEEEKGQIDAANAELDRQVREWNKKKNNESAKRGRQRRQNRLSRLTEDLAQAQAERNFWQARAVAQGAGVGEWKDVPEDVKDDLVADFRIDPDDLLLPPEDDF